MSNAAIIGAGAMSIVTVIGIGLHSLEQISEARLSNIFKDVGVSPTEEKIILEVVNNQDGNCVVLNANLQQKCEKVKTALALQSPK